jgi:hypothetical protein
MPLQEENALLVGIQQPAPKRDSFTSVQDCLTACDDDGDKCVGITVLSDLAPLRVGKSCMFIRADTDNGVFKRSMIHTSLNRLALPSAFICPSGMSAPNGASSCKPITTPQVAVMVLKSTGTCSAATIESVRSAVAAFLSNPNSAHGELSRCLVGLVDV